MQRAVETPPHPGASSSGFYAPTQPAAGPASAGAAGDLHRASTYADLRSSRSVPHRCSTLVMASAVQAPLEAPAKAMDRGRGGKKGNLGNPPQKSTLTH